MRRQSAVKSEVLSDELMMTRDRDNRQEGGLYLGIGIFSPRVPSAPGCMPGAHSGLRMQSPHQRPLGHFQQMMQGPMHQWPSSSLCARVQQEGSSSCCNRGHVVMAAPGSGSSGPVFWLGFVLSEVSKGRVIGLARALFVAMPSSYCCAVALLGAPSLSALGPALQAPPPDAIREGPIVQAIAV